MRSSEEGLFIVVKLDKGERIFNSLTEVIEKHDIRSGLVLSGIGMLSNVKLGYYSGEEHSSKTFEKPRELVAMHGSITTGEETVIHLHCALAGENYEVIGGHLMEAEVAVIAEIVIAKLSEIVLGREFNPKTGLKELSVR